MLFSCPHVRWYAWNYDGGVTLAGLEISAVITYGKMNYGNNLTTKDRENSIPKLL